MIDFFRAFWQLSLTTCGEKWSLTYSVKASFEALFSASILEITTSKSRALDNSNISSLLYMRLHSVRGGMYVAEEELFADSYATSELLLKITTMAGSITSMPIGDCLKRGKIHYLAFRHGDDMKEVDYKSSDDEGVP